MRLDVYEKTLERLQVEAPKQLYMTGICWTMRYVIAHNCDEYLYVPIHLSDFPEIIDQKPLGPNEWSWWFPLNVEGYNSRCEVLRNAITEVKKLL